MARGDPTLPKKILLRGAWAFDRPELAKNPQGIIWNRNGRAGREIAQAETSSGRRLRIG